MGALKTLLVTGGVVAAISEISKSSNGRNANVTTKSPDAEAIKNAFVSDPGMMNFLKGNKGDAGFGYNATSSSSVTIGLGSKTF